MRSITTRVIQILLRALGLKTLNAQFFFSYVLIFACAASTAGLLFIDFGRDAGTIDAAGRQRMLSQRVAKEAWLVAAGLEQRRSVDDTIAQFEASQRGLLEGDPARSLVAVGDPAARAQLERVGRQWDEYKRGLLAYLEQPGPERIGVISRHSSQVLEEAQRAVDMMTEQAVGRARAQQLAALLMTGTILFIVVAGRMFGMTVLMEQIDKLRRSLTAVGKGDFSLTMDIDDKDNEVGQMCAAYNDMVAHTGDIVAGVTRATAQVSDAADRMGRALNDTERGVRRQHTDIDQLATAMNEMAATVQEVAGNTGRAAQAAESANQEAATGRRVVGQTLDGINALARQVEEAGAVMDRLKADSQEVGKVLAVINGIAEQTNLLALNAAIEAARAGDQGRGFAVVADEVRTLAQRTQQSTQEIRDIIERLQSQAQEAAQAMESSRTQAQDCVERTAEAGGALERIVHAVGSIADMTGQIAAAAEQQSQVAGEMDRRVTDIGTVVDETNEAVKQTVAATQDISEQMDRLRGLIARFRTDVKGLDLSAAKAAHLAWKGRLRAYLDGRGTLTREQAVSHHDCAFGKWYYGEGKAGYGHVPEMQAIEMPHADLHRLIKQIIEHREAGRMGEAERLYEQVEPLSRRIVGLIERIEQKAA